MVQKFSGSEEGVPLKVEVVSWAQIRRAAWPGSVFDIRILRIRITGPKDEVIFEGDLSRDGKLDQVPENWRRRTQVLCRTLDQALDGSAMPQRQPRPRVVPPAAPKPEN